MSKNNSEFVAVKTQLKVKFPQAVITKIRTLPLVILKMFRIAVWRKTQDGCFWHVCKTINFCRRKVAAGTTLLKSALWIFFFKYSRNFDIFSYRTPQKGCWGSLYLFQCYGSTLQNTKEHIFSTKLNIFFFKKLFIRCMTGCRIPLWKKKAF